MSSEEPERPGQSYERWYDRWIALWTVSWRRNTAWNIAASVVFVAIAAAAVLFVVSSGGGTSHPHAGSSTSSSPTPTTSTSTTPPLLTDDAVTGTGSASTTGSGTSTSADVVTVDDARRTVVTYLNAVNVRDRNAAGALICSAMYPTWLQNINGANSDFNFTVIEARFTGSDPAPSGGLVAHYTLNFNDNTFNDVDFTVVEDNGSKICGVQKG